MGDTFRISLRAARVNAEMTLAEAAKAAGIGKNTLIRYERGENVPRVNTLEKLAQAYGIPKEMLRVP